MRPQCRGPRPLGDARPGHVRLVATRTRRNPCRQCERARRPLPRERSRTVRCSCSSGQSPCWRSPPRSSLARPVTANGSVEARLYDARGADRPIDMFRDPPGRLRNHQLLWVDVAGRDPATLRALAEPLGLAANTVEALGRAADRPLVRRHDDYIHAGFRSAEAAPDGSLEIVPLDLVAAPNMVLTVRNGPVAAFDRFRDEIDGMTRVESMDTATFTSALVDSILNGYLALVEDLERRIERARRRCAPRPATDRSPGGADRAAWPHRLAAPGARSAPPGVRRPGAPGRGAARRPRPPVAGAARPARHDAGSDRDGPGAAGGDVRPAA